MLLLRAYVFAFALIVAGSFIPQEARAFDLDHARAEGAVLADALALGDRGDWAGAAAIAAREQDPLVSDIVLWRKLRAGKGSLAEYQDFVNRRGSWPGQDILARVVTGGTSAPDRGGDGLSGAAAANWKEFGRLWQRDRYDEAAVFLAAVTGTSHKLGVPGVWADRRQVLARRLARTGNPELAYLLASQHHMGPEDGYAYSELEWLAGWISLRFLNNPKRALPHFQRFNASVDTPISLGRGGYWLGRTYEALGDPANANEWYRAAAVNETSFYGQLAAARIGAKGDPKLVAGDLPDWSKSPALRSDDVRLAVVLHYAGEDPLAFQVFSDLANRLDGGATLGALAGLGLELGQPHFAVRIAKNAARKGVLIYPAYYPVTELARYATAVEPALAMSIARQETELNPRAVSPAGARGLMQLMPATAKKVAGWIGEDYSADRLLDDWQYNARLGQTYLARRIDDYGGSYVLAAAAYNAGSSRVDDWIAQYGDPRLPGTDIIDWIETIPFGETRNYVQRVMEGLYVYRARLAGTAGPMTIVQDLSRGVR